MIVGVVRCECIVYDAQSLKEKRAVLNSVKARIKNRFNVSIAEVGFQDMWQRTELALATVGGSKELAEKELQQAIHTIEQRPDIECAEITYEWL